MRVYWFFAAIIILSYCVYAGVAMYTLPTAPNRIGPEKISLSSVTQVGTNTDLTKNWNTPSGSTLVFYISPIINDRTSVVGNEYATAVNIGRKQSLNILIAPDAGRSKFMAPATLEVIINGQDYPDVIEINAIELQRWNCVAIVKQGRVFNIYVNVHVHMIHII